MPDATIRNATNHTLNIAFGVVAPLEDGNGVVHGKTIKLNLAMFVHSVELKTLTNVLIPRCPSFPKVALLSKNVDEGFDTRLFKFPKLDKSDDLKVFLMSSTPNDTDAANQRSNPSSSRARQHANADNPRTLKVVPQARYINQVESYGRPHPKPRPPAPTVNQEAHVEVEAEGEQRNEEVTTWWSWFWSFFV